MVYSGYNKTIKLFRSFIYYSCSSILNLHEGNLKECVRYFAPGMKGGSLWICAEKCKRTNERSVDIRGRLRFSKICSIIWKLIVFIWSSNECSDQKIRIGVLAVEIIRPTLACNEVGMNNNGRQRWGSMMNPLGKPGAISHHVWQIQRVLS